MVEHEHILEAPRLEFCAPIARNELRHLFFVVDLVDVGHLRQTVLQLFALLRRRHLDGSLHFLRPVNRPRPSLDVRGALLQPHQVGGQLDLGAAAAMHQPLTGVD